MSHSYHNSVPKISVTTYESVEENVEVNNYFNSQKIRNNFNSNVTTLSSNPSHRKINVDRKSMTSEDSNLKHSLSPNSSSDINCLTDVEAISDSDDENNFIQTGCLSPSLQRFCILTDIEDLSEDERLSSVNKINEVHTDTENFSDELDYLKNELKEKKYIEEFFPQPHREVSFHSKDSIICTLTSTNEINPVWLKSPREELEGFESEEEIVTIPENYNNKSCKGNSDIYHHDNYSGVVESSEFIKKYQNKQKSCVLMTNKKSFLSDADFIKKRVRNKRQNSNDKRENFEKESTESLKTELKSLLTPSLNNIMQSTGLQLNNKNYANKRHPEYNNLNKLVIHDNINGFSVSFNFENQNSVILNIGRDSENLSLKWYKNGSASGSEVNLSQYQNEKSLSCSDHYLMDSLTKSNTIYNEVFLDNAIKKSRKEFEKLIKDVDGLENEVTNMKKKNFRKDYEINTFNTEDSFDIEKNFKKLQFTVFQLLSYVKCQENYLRDSLIDIKKSLNDLNVNKISPIYNIQKILEPSLRGNFKTASLPYHWWNRSMPCLPLIQNCNTFLESQKSVNIKYFSYKNKAMSTSTLFKDENSAYCIWLPYTRPESLKKNGRAKGNPLMVRTPSESTVPDNFEHLDEWKPLDYANISPDLVQEKLKTMLNEPGDHDETLTNILIDMLIEQETAKLAASGEISSCSSESDPHETSNSEPPKYIHPIPIISSPKVRRNGVGGSQRLSANQRPTLREIYKSHDSDSDNEYDYIVTEPQEKTSARKVTFRLESEDDEIIYPGQSDDESEIITMSSKINQPIILEDVKFDASINVAEKTLKRVERRFERMASETLEDNSIAKNAVEGEYHKIVSQLSNEEVDVANQIWDRAEPSTEITTNAISILYQNSIDKIPPKPNPRYSIDISTALSLDEDNTNYSTKKQFWEEKSKNAYQPPLPKPRHSISLPVNPNERSIMKNSSLDLNCTSFDTSDHTEISEMIKKPLMSNQTTNNFVVNDSTCQQIKGIDDMPKSITLENHSYKSRPINRLDSEAEYIQKYGEESLAFENQGFQEDDLNDVNSTKHIQSLEESTLKSPINKEITSNQYIEQIKPQILSMQMEQEFSPEHKSLKNITNKNSLSQEVLINRQIHKHIFSNELDEQIDSLIPEVKHFKVNSETDFSTDLLINNYVEKSSSISEKSITKTESNESSTIDDLPEEKINKNANIISKYSSSLSQDLIEEIPLDTCSEIEQSEKNKLQTEYISSSLNKDLQQEYVINPIEETKKVHIIHTPEEHIQDTIWEVTQIRSDSQDIIENINTRKQEEFQNKSVKQDNILELTEISKNDMTNNLAKDIAEQLVNEIEIELTKRQDVLANLQHLVVSPEHLKQLENSGYLDIDGDDLKIKLIESVLAKKSREQLKNISKNDTVTSSIEITDEDLKSSGFEIEYDGITKLPIINDIIIDHKNNKSDEKTIPENLNCQSEIFNHNDNEKNSNAINNEVLIHCHLKNVNNEETLTEISQNCEVFSTGQITHDSSSQKNHRDISIDVSERITLNTDIKQIDNHEKGSYIKLHDDELFHDIIKYSETKLCENSIILQQRASELENNRIDTSECFDIESEVQETEGKNSIKTKQKYVDTKLRDFDQIVKKESEEHEEITDDGSTIISNINKESHAMSNILIETCSKSKNEISLKDEQICSPISNSPLVKHLSTESLPSKDNSIHSPTSPSSSSIDIREEKHVNFDSVTLRKQDSVNIMKLTAKRPADSSSSESHYQSFDLTSSSRPCSSDVDGLLACSSEYESAISVPSNEYHTAISSLSSRESMKSLDSESSGNLASVENSEASETLIASTGDLDYDIEVPNDILEEDIKIESYEQKIPMQIIRGESLPLIAETSDKKYSSIYKTQPFSQPTINSENNAQKMKRSHEMTFHPVPKHITSDSLSDSSSHEEKQYSSESMSISSTEGPAIQTVVETTNGYPKSVISSFSLSDDSATLAEKSTTTNKDNKYLKEEELNQDVTILSSSLVENETLHNVSTQITSKFEEVQKKGHRRSISSVNEIVFEGINLNSSKEIDLKDSSNEIIASKQCDQFLYNILTKTTSIETKKCENILDLGKNVDVTSICKHSDSGKLTSPISEKHSFEHIDDVAEADAAFQMVPHVSPVIPTSLPPTIPEDPFSEDEDDLIEDTSNNVPNIMVTEHMAPLIDHGFCYPDLDLEAKELENKSTPETPASISSKESSDTDQGKEYVLNNNFNPHEESSCTLKEHIALEKVEELVEKDSISLGESFEIIENNEEIPNLEEEFVIVDEIDKDIKCQLINMEGTEDKNLHSSIISDNTIIQESDIDKEYSNLNWVELQFDDDNTVNEIFGYNMEYDRPPLEDIKEEDTEDLHSSKVGSVGSQVSQSIGSFGSMKESFSSTPESKKYLGKSLEHDNLSINSLQEFERLEQLARIESMQAKSSGSLASNTSSSSNSRKEDNSLGSLKDFEAIEAACIQTEMIENKALESEKLLINNESVFKIYDIGQISNFHVEQNEEISEKLHSDDDNLTSTDSLDLKTIVTDIKPSISAERIFVESISAEFDDCMNSSISSRDFSSSLIDDHSKESSNRDSLILGSNDSLGPSSSTATNATYHCETGSNLSSSFTSGGSNTMVSSMEGLDKAGIKNEWFEGSEFIETQEKDHDDTKYVHRIIKMPAEIHKISAKDLEKVGTLDDFVEKFNPEVYEDKIEHTDEFGNTVTVKKMQKRMIFETEEELNKGISKEELNECLRKLSDNISDQYEYSNATANNFQGPTEENQVVSNISTLNELQRDATKSELKYEISMDDDTEIDLREHDWRFQHQIKNESDDVTKPGPSESAVKTKSKETVSEL